ncbi:hypothetical protein [Nitratifractor salsuginis]|uniref:Uncharacterized protein n=1 Tax=Nitratifractor salsuginis (strain DSM 16511 / JCM 12458 / E9I37-1) TaxID=749222 RepID=E6WY52_NITSE|nr:hypothetical protein [Nitratifractor salsuginis]ADV46426.1 hypothetical protein Nitsa_1173 [Nitratifractor salsuginis DSM 16511]
MQETPPMTPEMYAELMQQQGQQPEGGVPPQAPATDPGTMQPPAQPAPAAPAAPQGEPSPEEIEQARKLLGLDKVDQMEQEFKQLKAKAIKDQMHAKFPNVPDDVVEEEIKKFEAVNPQLAEAMRTTPEGMEMAYKAALASIRPNEKPDNLTKGSETGENEGKDDLAEKVKSGKADEVDLGSFILGA